MHGSMEPWVVYTRCAAPSILSGSRELSPCSGDLEPHTAMKGCTRGKTGTSLYGAPWGLPGHYLQNGLQGRGDACKVPLVGRYNASCSLPGMNVRYPAASCASFVDGASDIKAAPPWSGFSISTTGGCPDVKWPVDYAHPQNVLACGETGWAPPHRGNRAAFGRLSCIREICTTGGYHGAEPVQAVLE